MAKAQASLIIILGTTNAGKVREMKAILADSTHRYLALNEYPHLPSELLSIAETGTTFAENALIKAKTIGDRLQLPVIAEDSGLIVQALAGRPGVYSHRYGPTDEARNIKLLAELKDIPQSNRLAAFVCAAVYYDPLKRVTKTAEGQVEGYITLTAQGHNGFGYDPIFYSAELKKTFAESSALEKNQVSHRKRALSQLKTMY